MKNTCNCLICNEEIEDSGASSGIYNEGVICHDCYSRYELSNEYKDLAEISLQIFAILDRDKGLIEIEKYHQFKDILENTCEWWGMSGQIYE